MKKCPYCAEEIQDEAIKCKHCGEMINKPIAQLEEEAGSNKIPTLTILGVLLFLGGFGTLLYFWMFFDPSVTIPTQEFMGQTIGGGKINNLGLMNDRQNGIIVSSLFTLIGFICIILGQNSKSKAIAKVMPIKNNEIVKGKSNSKMTNSKKIKIYVISIFVLIFLTINWFYSKEKVAIKYANTIANFTSEYYSKYNKKPSVNTVNNEIEVIEGYYFYIGHNIVTVFGDDSEGYERGIDIEDVEVEWSIE